MTGPSCCSSRRPGDPRARLAIAGGIIPALALAVLPKCPACLAAYVAVGTGLSIPASAGTPLRGALAVVCLASVAFLAIRGLGRFRRLARNPR